MKYGIEAEEAKKKKEKKKWAQWKEKLQGDPERLKNVTAGNMAELAGDFVSLISRLDNHEERRMTLGVYSDWRNLVPIFGLEVAKAFKDGLNRYWRLYSPVLDSESNNSQYPWELSVGLTGLAFESSESPDWTQRLTSDEANLASRYAACEMSEFPAWTKDVAWNRPQEFASVMQKEIAWEFNKPNKENIFPRNLSKLAYSRDEIAMACHSSLLRLLEERDPENNKALDRALISLLGKGATDIIRLGNLARLRFTTAKSDARKLAWLLVWFCVGADGAATALEQWLDTTKEKDEGDKLIISLATALFGNSHGVCFKSNYQDFLRAEPLSRLVEILYRHIREEEDPHRSGHYTPTARDNAERVRNKLVETLATNPSRENYATLASLASRLNSNWIAYLAKACAERAADFEAWKASDVAEFAKIGTSIPRDDRALFDLALLRLDDLKLDLEYGDTSIADMLVDDPETVLRNWFIRELRKSSRSHYAVVPEEEMADGKRPDIRFHAPAVNGPVPVELKIADHWTLAQLKERVQNQLIGQYLRDDATLYGVFLLVYKGTKTSWVDRSAKQRASSLNELCAVLQQEADSPIKKDAIFEEVRVIGIDLTKRGRPAS